jgi:hypothetical protein
MSLKRSKTRQRKKWKNNIKLEDENTNTILNMMVKALTKLLFWRLTWEWCNRILSNWVCKTTKLIQSLAEKPPCERSLYIQRQRRKSDIKIYISFKTMMWFKWLRCVATFLLAVLVLGTYHHQTVTEDSRDVRNKYSCLRGGDRFSLCARDPLINTGHRFTHSQRKRQADNTDSCPCLATRGLIQFIFTSGHRKSEVFLFQFRLPISYSSPCIKEGLFWYCLTTGLCPFTLSSVAYATQSV